MKIAKQRKPQTLDRTLDLVQVETLASRGMTMQQIADALGISEWTLYNRKKLNKEVQEAIKRGRAKGIGVVTNALFEQIRAGNTTAAIFWLKCNAQWKETIVHEGRDEIIIINPRYHEDSSS